MWLLNHALNRSCFSKSLLIKFIQNCVNSTFSVGLWNRTVAERAFNTLRPRQDGRHFVDDIFKCIFLNENAWISLEVSLKFVPKVRINNIPALVHIMAWRRSGDKPLSESMMDNLLTHTCVTRPQWVKNSSPVTYNTLPKTEKLFVIYKSVIRKRPIHPKL